MTLGDALFQGGDLSESLRAQETRVRKQVDALSGDQILSLPEEQIVEHVASKVRVEPLVLFEDQKVLEQKEIKIDVSGFPGRTLFRGSGPVLVPGHEIRVSIPFTGDAGLWKLTPNTFRSVIPYGFANASIDGRPGVLSIVIGQPADEPAEKIKRELDGALENIRFYVGNQRQQIDAFNTSIPALARQQITARKQRLTAQQGIQKLLGIPLKRRDGEPNMEPVRLTRQLVRPLPQVPKGGFPPEPGITDEDYDHILGVIRHTGRSFEQTPTTFAKHDEEELRDIVLANLNSHYQGDATGETFRKKGKTDIRIEADNRAAFVSECKVWRGATELKEAIEQLLGYLTWRDCRTALVVFNKHNAKFTELVAKIPATLESHPNFKRRMADLGAGEWRFVFTSPIDDAREVIVTVFLFNLFV